MLEINKIYHGDCLGVMKDIDDKSINLIIADIPYNIGKDKDWDKWKKQEDYIQYIGERFLQCQRVLKDNGSFYWFHNDFLQIVELQNWINMNTEFVFKQLITWNKYFKGSKDEGFCKHRLSNHLNRNYYGGFTEYALFYTFQDETGLTTVMLDVNNFTTLRQYFKEFQEALGLNLHEINRIFGHRKAEHAFYWKTTQWDLPTKEIYTELCKLPLKHKFLRREYEDLRLEYEDLRYTFNNQRVMTANFNDQHWNNNVWNYEIAPHDNHITPKPVALIENIILHSSNEEDVILDPFGGSGTTAIACLHTNRNYIMIEQEQKYIDIINKRINEEKKKYRFIL